MNKITVYQFTDPVCIWCWGNEPVMRAIDYLYGDKVDTEYIMGGLVEDIATLFEDRDSDEDAIASANERMHRNWIAASARHGMPASSRRAFRRTSLTRLPNVRIPSRRSDSCDAYAKPRSPKRAPRHGSTY